MNEGLIGQLFGQNLQAFPESTCQTEYMDILGGDMNDGRLPGQRTRSYTKTELSKIEHINTEHILVIKGRPDSVRNGARTPRGVISLPGTG